MFECLSRYSRKNSIRRPVSVILAWDLLNYLERTEIINLMAYLSPLCHPGTKLFAISWITETIPKKPGWFEITPQLELIYESMINEHIVSPEYSAPNIVDMMPSFTPHRLSITRMGMLEVVLQFKDLIQPPSTTKIPAHKLSAFSKVWSSFCKGKSYRIISRSRSINSLRYSGPSLNAIRRFNIRFWPGSLVLGWLKICPTNCSMRSKKSGL